MLQRGDPVPHFHVTTLAGCALSYSSIWQRKNLVLAILPHEDRDSGKNYVNRLLHANCPINTLCVVTRDSVDGLPGPGVLVADRWGEIVFATTSGSVKDLPPAEEIFDWVDYLQQRCPECEGEAK